MTPLIRSANFSKFSTREDRIRKSRVTPPLESAFWTDHPMRDSPQCPASWSPASVHCARQYGEIATTDVALQNSAFPFLSSYRYLQSRYENLRLAANKPMSAKRIPQSHQTRGTGHPPAVTSSLTSRHRLISPQLNLTPTHGWGNFPASCMVRRRVPVRAQDQSTQPA